MNDIEHQYVSNTVYTVGSEKTNINSGECVELTNPHSEEVLVNIYRTNSSGGSKHNSFKIAPNAKHYHYKRPESMMSCSVDITAKLFERKDQE